MRQQLLYFRHFVFGRLLLVRPAAYADIALDSHHAVGVEHAVRLSDYAHYFVPGSFCGWALVKRSRFGHDDHIAALTKCCSGAVHGIFHVAFFEEALDGGDFLRNGSARSADWDEAEV